MHRHIALALVAGSLLLLAGCGAAPSQPVETALNHSAAASDVALTQSDGGAPVLEVALAESVEQNDEECITQFNPATGTSTTTCYDSWHTATITNVVVENGSGYQIDQMRADSLNGETISTEIPWRSDEYYLRLTSETGETTTFSVEVSHDGESVEITGAGYDDSY